MHRADGRIDPALPLLWREPGVLQVGVDPRRALAVSGVSPDFPAVLRGSARACDAADAQALALLDAAGLIDRQSPPQRWDDTWAQVVGDGPAASAVVAGLRDAGLGHVSTGGEPNPAGPDLVVVVPSRGRGMEHETALVASTVAHLWAYVRDGRAVVGPLVVPGATSCQRCHDLHRADADPAWPALALAWEQQTPRPVSAATVSVLAATTTRQCLAWLRGARPACVGSTLEEQPDGQMLRVSWSVHPGCGCGWGSASDGLACGAESHGTVE